MTTNISAFNYLSGDILEIPFFKDGKPLLMDAPRCCLSLASCGSMRFRWNETNETRNSFFASHIGDKTLAPIELIHSRKVFTIQNDSEIPLLKGLQGDGIITSCHNIVPTVTVADCVPIFLFDFETGIFGVLHSGWKGTGIVKEAIDIMEKRFRCKSKNILSVIGPHIHSCCYTIDDERAEYFRNNFIPDCVETVSFPKHTGNSHINKLSLEKANIGILENCGVKNIASCKECTSCTKELGSFRRETAALPVEFDMDKKSRLFTVMAAFIMWK